MSTHGISIKEWANLGGPYKIIAEDSSEIVCPDPSVLKDQLTGLDPGAYVITNGTTHRPFFVEDPEPEPELEEPEEPVILSGPDLAQAQLDQIKRMQKTESELNREFYRSMLEAQSNSFNQTLSIIRENEKVLDRRLKQLMQDMKEQPAHDDDDDDNDDPKWLKIIMEGLKQQQQTQAGDPPPMPGE
jgi:hypothetical protein